VAADLVLAGLELMAAGYVPIWAGGPKGNDPSVNGPGWQKRPYTAQTFADFPTRNRPTGIGLVTTGLAVVDCDGAEGIDGFRDFLRARGAYDLVRDIPRATTPGGGLHFYWADPDGAVTNSGGDLGPLPKIDVRGQGGFIATPPTDRPGTPGYRWVTPLPALTDLPVAPDWIKGRISTTGARVSGQGDYTAEVSKWGRTKLAAIVARAIEAQGSRHDRLHHAAVAAGHLIVEADCTYDLAADALYYVADQVGLIAEGRDTEVLRTIDQGILYPVTGRYADLGALITRLGGAEK